MKRTMKSAALGLAAAAGLVICSQCSWADDAADIDSAQKALKSRDYPTALKILQSLADKHVSEAECLLGDMYEFGNGVPQDHAEALKWYKLAARGDNGFTIHVMQYGAVPKDAAALKPYVAELKLAAQAGEPESQRMLGTLYFKGQGVKQDFEQAFNLFEKAAKQGSVDATNNLGFMYQHGAFVAQDYSKAAQLYQKAADLGNGDAENNLGFLYVKGLGVPQDNKKAAELFAEADKNGCLDGTSNLGWMYEKGTGVDRDYNKAVHLYARAAANGVAAAKYNLGYMYQYGLGVNRRLSRAVKLYRLAAAMGYPQGENQLSFVSGGNAPTSYKLALKYYKKEADRKADMFRLVPNFDIYD